MYGWLEAPKIPGARPSRGRCPARTAEREPSRIGSPSAGKVTAPSAAGAVAGRLRVGHVRDRADVGVERLAARVGGHRVHPRDALVLLQDRRAARLVDCAWLVSRKWLSSRRLSALASYIANAVRRRPGEQRLALERVEDRPVAGRVEGPRHRGERAVGLLGLHGDVGGLHLLRLAVDEVAGRVAGHERELDRREAERRRDGVRPGEVLGVADQLITGTPNRLAPETLSLPGIDEVRLVEALRPLPGEVRVAEHHAAAVLGRVAAEPPAVRAETAGAAASESPSCCTSASLGSCGRRRGARLRPGRRRRLRVGDPVDRRRRRSPARPAGRSAGRRPLSVISRTQGAPAQVGSGRLSTPVLSR